MLRFFLRIIYFLILSSHLIYGCEVSSQNQNNVLVQKLQKLHGKAACFINLNQS